LLRINTQFVFINIRLVDAVLCALILRQDCINDLIDFSLLEVHLGGNHAQDLAGLYLVCLSDIIGTDISYGLADECQKTNVGSPLGCRRAIAE